MEEPIRTRLARMKLLVATPTGGTVLEVFAPSEASATVSALKGALEQPPPTRLGLHVCASALWYERGFTTPWPPMAPLPTPTDWRS